MLDIPVPKDRQYLSEDNLNQLSPSLPFRLRFSHTLLDFHLSPLGPGLTVIHGLGNAVLRLAHIVLSSALRNGIYCVVIDTLSMYCPFRVSEWDNIPAGTGNIRVYDCIDVPWPFRKYHLLDLLEREIREICSPEGTVRESVFRPIVVLGLLSVFEDSDTRQGNMRVLKRCLCSLKMYARNSPVIVTDGCCFAGEDCYLNELLTHSDRDICVQHGGRYLLMKDSWKSAPFRISIRKFLSPRHQTTLCKKIND